MFCAREHSETQKVNKRQTGQAGSHNTLEQSQCVMFLSVNQTEERGGEEMILGVQNISMSSLFHSRLRLLNSEPHGKALPSEAVMGYLVGSCWPSRDS